jgi:hypothetical protein
MLIEPRYIEILLFIFTVIWTIIFIIIYEYACIHMQNKEHINQRCRGIMHCRSNECNNHHLEPMADLPHDISLSHYAQFSLCIWLDTSSGRDIMIFLTRNWWFMSHFLCWKSEENTWNIWNSREGLDMFRPINSHRSHLLVYFFKFSLLSTLQYPLLSYSCKGIASSL